ncbi:MAG: HNH endonuclease [Elusimicrobia bacterium]|nr:HNH endonuclease [Elusimicrobiota bacterium]
MNNLSDLSNDELIRSLKSLVGDERGVVVAVLKHLTEFERRRLAENKAFPSLFEYCVRELRYAQGEAFRRIRAARAAEKFEVLYGHIESGELSLTTVAMLEPHLKWDNYRKLIREAKGSSTREVEALVASLNPVAAAPAERIRILSVAPTAAPVEAADDLFSSPTDATSKNEIQAPPAPPAAPVEPATQEIPMVPAAPEAAPSIAPAAETAKAPAAAGSPSPPPPPPPPQPPLRRVHFSFTGDEAMLSDFERAKELSRHKWPAGKAEEVFAGALKVLLDKIDPDRRRRRRDRARRLAAGARSRDIPRAVKDEVWDRDGGRCAFRSDAGRVCGARAGLEFDHVRPWALGGGSGDAANVRLLCRTHNDLEARRAFGGALVDAAVARRRDGLRREVKI